MIQVSDAYKELVKSNIRPKCEPIIKVSGIDNTGKEIELVWNAKNIKDLKFKRGIDPVGRELPYMELTWTEIYTGKLNAENYPEKYNNIAKYMNVELSFVQDLGFYNTWKTLFNSGTTWKNLFDGGITWKQLKKQVTQETIKMPKMFLSAKPTIKGQTITWIAKDMLNFANGEECIEFFGNIEDPLKLKNLVSYFLSNLRGSFINSTELVEFCTNTISDLLLRNDIEDVLDKTIICDGEIKNIIMNLLSIYNYYLDFRNGIITIKKSNPSNAVCAYKDKVLYNQPEIENSTNISSYNFKYRIAKLDTNTTKSVRPDWIESFGDGYYRKHYALEGYGQAFTAGGESDPINYGQPKTADLVEPTDIPTEIVVMPITYNAYNEIKNIDNIGEVFIEDNPINPYDLNSNVITERIEFLNRYFSNYSSSISFDALANVSVETGDVIQVDTNLYDEQGNKIIKNGLVVYLELSYNGSLKQKIKAHEVSV